MNISAEGSGQEEVRDHGGSLDRAEALFLGAPKPWIDCSTGINPHPYPFSPVTASAWQRLPEEREAARLCEVAAQAYGAPSGRNVAAAPGTQILLPLVASLVPPGRAAVLGPTYAEHARCAALAGHSVRETGDIAEMREAALAVVVNPNNPDGRLLLPAQLLELAEALDRRGGLLVVDEAFMDVAPDGASLVGQVEEAGNLVVLRSFGKFYGLAGLRLGFAVASRGLAARIAALLGPWAVSGPALAIAREALGDREWARAMCDRLDGEARRLDRLLAEGDVRVSGGTSLYRFLRTPDAAALFGALGAHGIYVRRFDNIPEALRIGLPPDEAAWQRLAGALREWKARSKRKTA